MIGRNSLCLLTIFKSTIEQDPACTMQKTGLTNDQSFLISPRPWKIPFDHVIIFRWLLDIRIRLDRLFVPLGRLWHEVPWKPQLRPQGSRHKVINSITTWNNFDSTFLCKYFDCFFFFRNCLVGRAYHIKICDFGTGNPAYRYLIVFHVKCDWASQGSIA